MTPCTTVIDAHNVVALIIQTKKGSTWSANFFFFFTTYVISERKPNEILHNYSQEEAVIHNIYSAVTRVTKEVSQSIIQAPSH